MASHENMHLQWHMAMPSRDRLMAGLASLTTHLCSHNSGGALNRNSLLQQRPMTGQEQVLGQRPR